MSYVMYYNILFLSIISEKLIIEIFDFYCHHFLCIKYNNFDNLCRVTKINCNAYELAMSWSSSLTLLIAVAVIMPSISKKRGQSTNKE